MRIWSKFAVFFYIVLTLFCGVLLLLFATHGVPRYLEFSFGDFLDILYFSYHDPHARWITGAVAVGLLVLNYLFLKFIVDDEQRERTVAFDNPTGRVSVSLSALEDLTRRVIGATPDVQDVRAIIRARKKGLEIAARLVLNADINIPQLTADLQELVKQKIQETMGIDETVTVRLHIAKISPAQKKAKRSGEDELRRTERAVPFQGYRA